MTPSIASTTGPSLPVQPLEESHPRRALVSAASRPGKPAPMETLRSDKAARHAVTFFALLLPALLTSCGPYAQIQLDLVTQSRTGLQRIETARQQDAAAITQALADRRQRLDDAFDADVLAQTTLTPDWVIESRRAYAAGLDCLATAKAAHDAATSTAADNAAAADEALALLERMLTAQANVLKLDLSKQPLPSSK